MNHLDNEVGHQCGSGDLKGLSLRLRKVRADRLLNASGIVERVHPDALKSDKFFNP